VGRFAIYEAQVRTVYSALAPQRALCHPRCCFASRRGLYFFGYHSKKAIAYHRTSFPAWPSPPQ